MRNNILNRLMGVSPVVLLMLLGISCNGRVNQPIPSPLPTSSPLPPTPESAIVTSTESPTAPPTSAPALTEDLPPQEGVLYHDAFTQLDSGWPQLEFDNYYIGYHEPEYYHVEVNAPNDRALAPLPDKIFESFTAEIEVFTVPDLTDTSGEFSYGLVFRRTGDQFYAFTISPIAKKWFVLKSSSTGLETLQEGSDETIQGIGVADRLRVDAKGADFSLLINGQLVSSVNDPDYPSGGMAFFVQTFESPKVHIHYDSLTVREFEAPPPGDDVLYHDDFTKVASGWPHQLEFDNYYIGYHEPEYYHVEVYAPNDRALVPLPDESFETFTAEIEVFAAPDLTDTSGDFRYGLVFRRSGQEFYAFTISPTAKKWFVLKNSLSGMEVLQEGEDKTIQGIGVADRLRVDARGSNFFFHINSKFVRLVNDPDYTNGEIAFFVQTFESPRAHIHYDSLTIRQVQAPQLECEMISQALNLRTGPSTRYSLIASLVSGDRFEPVERTSDGLWIRARMIESDREGWLANDRVYFSCNIPINDLPVTEP
jgi:hypothetical protein